MIPPGAQRRWLSIIGIGEDGVEGLSPAAMRLLAQASLVVGGKRHLDLARLLTELGMGGAALTICETMGGPRQRLRRTSAAEFSIEDIDPLNTVAIEIVTERDARIVPRVAGLPDDWFEHDGQITKREVR